MIFKCPATIVNDQNLCIFWKPPYHADVTNALQSGNYHFEIKVTNLWPNRLIGDEQLPVENEYETLDWPGKLRVLDESAIKETSCYDT